MHAYTVYNCVSAKRERNMFFFILQNAFPARYKGFHYYNMSPIFEGILTLIKPIMSKKWTDRVSSIECMILTVNNFYNITVK